MSLTLNPDPPFVYPVPPVENLKVERQNAPCVSARMNPVPNSPRENHALPAQNSGNGVNVMNSPAREVPQSQGRKSVVRGLPKTIRSLQKKSLRQHMGVAYGFVVFVGRGASYRSSGGNKLWGANFRYCRSLSPNKAEYPNRTHLKRC